VVYVLDKETQDPSYRVVSGKTILGKNEYGKPYIGKSFVTDYKEFWAAMHDNENAGLQNGEAAGLCGVDFEAQPVSNWIDTGSLQGLGTRLSHVDNEKTWKVGNLVVKYIEDPVKCEALVMRSKMLYGFVPTIKRLGSFVSYDYVEGSDLGKRRTTENFGMFLKFLDSFFMCNYKADLQDACTQFYVDKTEGRIQLFKDRFGDLPQVVNEVRVGDTVKVPDEYLDGIATRFHGDLRLENVIVGNDKFSLIDVRSDFGGNIQYGDIYWELGKVLHGIRIDYARISEYQSTYDNGHAFVGTNQPYTDMELESMFKEWVLSNRLDWKRVNYMFALICIHSSPLHDEGYGRYLMARGLLEVTQ
jgi:hypothetical protein